MTQGKYLYQNILGSLWNIFHTMTHLKLNAFLSKLILAMDKGSLSKSLFSLLFINSNYMTVILHSVFVFSILYQHNNHVYYLFIQSLASLSQLWGVLQNSNKLLSQNHRGRLLSEGAQLVLPSRAVFSTRRKKTRFLSLFKCVHPKLIKHPSFGQHVPFFLSYWDFICGCQGNRGHTL